MTDNLNRKLAAIMFADIVSYSRLMGSNEGEALKLLKDFENISARIVKKYKGIIIKKNGDQIFCEFASAKNAVDASLKIQKELSKYNDSKPKDFKLEVRIGIHIGDVVKREDGDIHGDGVNVAARIQPLASPGGICVSGAVSDALSSHPNYDVISKGEQELKNILQKHSIFQIKTGYETIEPQGNANVENGIKWFKYIFGIIAILLIVIIIFTKDRSRWWYEEKKDNILRNFYIHVTSNEDYLNNYYVDYGYGSVNFYDKNEYFVSSIDDSLLTQIKNELFKNISSEFARQDMNIDMSFSNSEVEALNKLYFPKIRETDLSFKIDSLQILMDNIEKVLSKNIDYYETGLPDVLIRYFIYKLINVNNGEESYLMEGSATWGPSLRERPALQWTPYGNKYSVNDGIYELKEDLISRCKGKILELRYGGSIGQVVEKLDYETVKIKLKKPGLLKKKMKLSTERSYHWAKGGVEIRIEDYEQYFDYLSNTKGKIIWNFYNNDSLDPGYVDFDEIEWEDHKSRNTKEIEVIINDLRQKLNNNFFNEKTTSNMDDVTYYMEVIEVQDSIAYAKITGSKWPVFKVRENDMIYISK